MDECDTVEHLREIERRQTQALHGFLGFLKYRVEEEKIFRNAIGTSERPLP